MTDLPEGWAETTLGELGEWRGGGTPSKSRAAYWTEGTIPWVSPKDMKRSVIDSAADNITQQAVDESATQLIPARSILLVTRSGILQHSLPVAINSVQVAINQDLKALTPAEGVDPEFLSAQLRCFAREILSECAKSGTTVESIEFDKLKKRCVLFAPLAEQRRIVAKLDKLMARTARAKRELDCVPALIAKYKQAVLSAAFSGELTREWREAHGLSAATMTNVGDLASELRYGTAQKCYPEPKGTAVLRIPNVAGGRIDLSDLKYAVLPSTDLQRLRLEAGDVLVVRSNGSVELVGRPALVSDREAGLAYAGYLIRIRPRRDRVRSEYLVNMLVAPEIRAIVETGARSTSGVHNINSAELSALAVPIPDLTEQDEIVRRLQVTFRWLDTVAIEHALGARLLPKLEQAILTKAFRGELVPQDPNEEPASVLIERISAARSQQFQPKRDRKPRHPKRPPMATPKEQLMKDLANWPAQGVSFEELSQRISGEYEAIRTAVFELLAGPKPVVKQHFDRKARLMRLKRAAA